MHVSASRLWETLERYACYGATPAGGVSRPVFSPADLEARRALVADCQALGLPVRVDAAANVFCARPGLDPALPAILIGSHLDSVPDGGRYDGALGVLCALEVLHALLEADIPTRHTVQLVSLTGEEATAFGTSTFGSRALAGRLPDPSAIRLRDGRTAMQALADAGGDPAGLPGVRAALGPLACFLEVHIEQGTRLERAGQALGIVSGVCGIHRQRMVFRGEAGHAGTTAMGERHDALRAAARLVLAVSTLPEERRPPAVATDPSATDPSATDPSATATVGFLEVAPNSPNVIPGSVTLVTDLRSADAAQLAALAEGAASAARAAAAAESTAVDVQTVLDQAPVSFDRGVRAALAAAVRSLDGSSPSSRELTGQELASQAGHDAVHMQALAPAGMLFVRCAGGRSHRPDESVTPEDAALAAEALLRAVLDLDERLDESEAQGER